MQTPHWSRRALPPHLPRQSTSTRLKQTPSHPLSALLPLHTPQSSTPALKEAHPHGSVTAQCHLRAVLVSFHRASAGALSRYARASHGQPRVENGKED